MTRFFIFFLLLVACSSGTYAGWHSDHDSTRSKRKRKITSIHTTKPNTALKEYKSMLIAGAGTLPIRQVFEKLSPYLKEHYTKLEIVCNYEFLGSKRDIALTRLDTALEKYKPDMLLFIAADPDYERSIGTAGRGVYMDSKLQLSVIEPGLIFPIWKGELYIVGDVSRDALFIDMSTLLTSELNSNQIP
jgi:hypothetical protein